MTEDQIDQLKKMWGDENFSRADIASRLGVAKSYCERIAVKIGLPSRRGGVLPTHGVSREEFARDWMDHSLTRDEISFRLRIPRSTCADLAQAYGLPPRPPGRSTGDVEYIPTPEEIQEKCRYIQSRWTEEELEMRSHRRSPELQAFSYSGTHCVFFEASIV